MAGHPPENRRNSDTASRELTGLLEDVVALRDAVVAAGARRLHRFREYYPNGEFSPSACNLAHYLALRRRDLRSLQERLARAGVSSLGRSEAHVVASLDRLVALLGQAVNVAIPPALGDSGAMGFRQSVQFLEDNANALFGPPPRGHKARIMVTLPTEAGDDYQLVRNLIENGMNCARINCAHDHREVWMRMIENVRRARDETGRACPVLMDLAGHKLRTGPLPSGPAVLHIKMVHDPRGRVLGPVDVLLEDGSGSAPPAAAGGYRLSLPGSLFQRLSPGDRIGFTDTRGKRRYLHVKSKLADGRWRAICHQGAYLEAGTALAWSRRDAGGRYRYRGRFILDAIPGRSVAIRIFIGDRVLLAADNQPGGPTTTAPAGCSIPLVARIGCSHPEVVAALRPGEAVWFDDGKLGGVVDTIDDLGAVIEIKHARPNGVRLAADKGINFPDTEFNLPPLSDKDLEDLEFVGQYADMVGFSFVETLADIECLLRVLKERDIAPAAVVAKIETKRAVKNLPDLILGTIGHHPMGIMIARGDLAVELGGERLAEIQEEILWLCEAAHVPVIWATQVLETLTKKGVVSRPEFTDAAMSGRAECVMLNKGPFVVDSIHTLEDILLRMQAHQAKKSARLRALASW